MAASLTAVIQDALLGRPAAGLRVQVYWVEPHGDVLLRAAATNADGTTAGALITGPKLSAGVYKLVLHAGDYFHGTHPDRPRCFDVLPVVFVVDDASAGRRLHIALSPTEYAVRCE